MRLVDAQGLMVQIPYEELNAKMVIANAPTVDAEPVRHGYWIVVDDPCSLMWRCSVCGETRCYDNYCGNCGAKMDVMDDVREDG